MKRVQQHRILIKVDSYVFTIRRFYASKWKDRMIENLTSREFEFVHRQTQTFESVFRGGNTTNSIVLCLTCEPSLNVNFC